MGAYIAKYLTPDGGTSNKDNKPEDNTDEMMRGLHEAIKVPEVIKTLLGDKQEISSLREEIRTVREEIRTVREEIRTVREVLEQKFEKVDEILKILDSGPNSSLDSNSKKPDQTESSWLPWKRNKPLATSPLKLRFFYPEKNTVYDNLLEELKTKIRPDKCDIYWEKCKEPAAASDTPLLVLCINISRIGVDIDDALRCINRGNFIILLIVHMREAHVLPEKETTLEKEHDHVKHVIEVAYTAEKGLYNCEKNKRAKERLEMILHPMKRA